MTTRKQIRDRVAGIIAETHPGLKVFAGQFFAVAEDELDFAAVYFQEGQTIAQDLGLGLLGEDSLDIDVYSTAGDDNLDALADPIVEAISTDQALQDMTLKVTRTGYQYHRDEGQAHGALKHMFDIAYVVK